MNIKLRNTLKESKKYKDVVKCPKCGFEYLHMIEVAVAPKGELYQKSGAPFQDGLTHRNRDKLITFLQCENCMIPKKFQTNPNDDELIRIEVNHKGMTLSGIYHATGGISRANLNTLKIREDD